MRDDPQILQRRFTAFVRPLPAKVLASKARCTERTAENFRRGLSWPTARHWLHLTASFGRDLTEAVFHPNEAAQRLAEECAALEQQLAERRAALGLVAGDHRSFSPRVAKAAAEVRTRA